MTEHMQARRLSPTGHRVRRMWWEVVRPFWLGIRWPLIALLAILGLVLGYFGFDSSLAAHNASRSFSDKLYLSLQLFGLQSGTVDPPVPWQLQTARFLAPLVAFYAAVSAIAAIFREQIAAARVRWFARDHVVICGLGRTGHLLAHTFRERNHRVVAVEKDPVSTTIGECREEGTTVVVGDAGDRVTLGSTGVNRARFLFAVSGDDGTNAQVAMDAQGLMRNRRGPPLTCFVQILDGDLAELLGAEMATRSSGDFRLEFFNPSERGAPALLNDHPPFDEQGTTPFGPPHLLVVGLGQMGSRLVLHAARRWKAIGGDRERLRITVVDTNANEHIESLLLRHPDVEKVCELGPRTIDVESPEFERGEYLFDADGRQITRVYICLGDDALGLTAALRLRRHLRGRPGLRIPIVVRTKQHGGLGALLVQEGEASDDLHVFGLLDLTCRPEVLLMGRTEVLARAIHEDYVRKQREEGRTPADNPSMVGWNELPEHLRESNRLQADDIGKKLRAVGCTIEPLDGKDPIPFEFGWLEVELLARMEHDRWCEERESSGWKHAAEKDVDRKETPYLVPWEDLPEDIQELDRNAVRAIPEVLAGAGFRVVRLRQEEIRHGGDTGG